MRFLLKRLAGVGNHRASTAKKNTSTAKAAAQSQSWGQQCGISCGCVLRIETQLSESSTSISPTIVSATYHAKRVLATSNNNDNGGIYLKPLTTQHKSNNSQPILSSCTTCPTLHQLATQTVEYLPGKTLDQVRNHIENGIVSTRSSSALRHTILRENVLPVIEEENKKKKLGTAKKSSSIQQLKNHEDNTKRNGRYEMKCLANQHVHCYDLVEDALTSMIHERMPSPRSNINRDADFYSITLGSYFSMYDTSNIRRRRRRHIDDSIDYLQRPDNDIDEEKLSTQANDWQKESPSSVFLFGDEHVVQSNNNTMSGYIYQYIKESINNQFAGNDKTIEGESQTEQTAPTTTYLQLLDMYSEVDVDDDDTQKDAKDDWLMHVDQMSTTA